MVDCICNIGPKGGIGMFMGEYEHTIDDKGRLIIPAKFRSQLGEGFVVTRGLDGCLTGYPLSVWHELETKLKSLSMTKRNARAFVRFLYAAATECQFDKQGRINLPIALRQHAALNKQCTIVGVSEHLEIWDTERWQRYMDDTAADFDQIAEDLDFDL